MNVKDRDYKKDTTIDHNDLEGQWIEQGSIFMYYGEAHADAIETRDADKQRLDLVAAELDEEIRNNWSDFSENKMTEASVKAKILQHARYKKAQKLLNNANHNVNVLASAKTALEHKKKGLENLVSLKIGGFYSEPKIKAARQKEVHKAQKEKIKSSRIRRKR